ncbi:MAG: hypothetical protein LBT20_02005 [Clostridiales bacterium]|nr:hypothetical protein [Clostridiales bacterium]
MVRFTVTKLVKRQSSGAVVTDSAGKVICAAYETPYGYVLNDGENKAAIGTLTFRKRTAIVTIQEDRPLVVKKRFFGRVKFPKESGYKKQGRMRRFITGLYLGGQLVARAQKNPIAPSVYYLDIWKGTNALRTILIMLAMNDFFLRKKS